MAEFIDFEAEEEGAEYNTDDENNDNECNENEKNFVDDDDDVIIPYQDYVPLNPYLGQALRMPRGLDSFINRVSYLIFNIFSEEKKVILIIMNTNIYGLGVGI